MTAPLVSILMVAHNAEQFINAAIRSARGQSLDDIEIVVVDDRSTDGTAAIIASHVNADRRVRLLHGPGKGLSAVRNLSLKEARGRYAAILDSDDIVHPRHLEGLLRTQAGQAAEICAANMIEFREGHGGFEASLFAKGRRWRQVRAITTAEFIDGGMIGASEVPLGYLKPLFDLDFLRAANIAYDERLRIGEDFDLVLRAMLAGGRFIYTPQTTYYYRKHGSSTSHRLQRSDVSGLLQVVQEYDLAPSSPLADHLQARRANLSGALLHLEAVAAIKAGRLIQAMRILFRSSEARSMTASSVREACIKRMLPGGLKRSHAEPLAQDEALSDRLSQFSTALSPSVPGS